VDHKLMEKKLYKLGLILVTIIFLAGLFVSPIFASSKSTKTRTDFATFTTVVEESFSADTSPSISIHQQQTIIQWITQQFSSLRKGTSRTLTITNPKGEVIQKRELTKSDDTISLDTTLLIPGSYTVSINNSVVTNFLWGVLAINFDKNIYLPEEKTHIDMAVLNEKGQMVCDANLQLIITDPSGKTTTLSTDSKEITSNLSVCKSKSLTITPDYSASFTTSQVGKYQVTLKATTSNGDWQITDSFNVESGPDIEITRRTATRIYPLNIYPVAIFVKPKADFQGVFQEKVPQKFNLSFQSKINLAKLLGVTPLQLENTGSSSQSVQDDTSFQTITWNVNWQAGKTYILHYFYDAPDISPEFYELGPSKVTSQKLNYTESRAWQIAVDDTPTQAYSAADTSTSSTTYTQLDSMTLTPGVGNYVVHFSTSIQKSPGGSVQQIALYVGNTQVSHTVRTIGSDTSLDTGVTSSNPIAIDAYVSTIGATDAIEVRWNTSAGTATAHERTIVIEPVLSTDITQVSETGTTTTTSATDVTIGTLTATPGAGDYLVFFDSSFLSPTVSLIYSSIYVGGTQIDHSERVHYVEASFPSMEIPVTTHAYVPNVAAGQTISIRWRTSAGTASALQRTMVIQKVNASNVFQASATADTSTSSTVDTPIDSMSISPGSGDYIAQFSTTINATDVTGSTQDFSLYIGNTQVAHTERTNYTEESYATPPVIDTPASTVAYLTNIGPNDIIRVKYRTDGGTVTAHQRTLTLYKVGASAATPTANSIQRKTWYDGTRYWRSYLDTTNGRIIFEYSTTGTSWTENTSAQINVSTSDFSIEADSSTLLVVYTSGNSIKSKKAASYPGTGFTWGTEQTTLTGTSSVSSFSFPVVSRDSSSYVWVAAKFSGNNVYYTKTIKETSATNDLPEDSNDTVYSLTDRTNSSNNLLSSIASLGSQNMYLTYISGTQIQGCKWINASSDWRDTSGTTCLSGYSTPTQVTATVDDTTTSTTYVQMDSMTITPGTGNYMIWFSTSIKGIGGTPSTSATINASVFVGGAQIVESDRDVRNEESFDSGDISSLPLSTQAFASFVGDGEAIEIKWKTQSGSAIAHQRTLTIQKVDPADISHVSSSVNTTASSTTYVQMDSMTLTPGAGDYLIYFSSSVGSSDVSSVSASIFVGGSEVTHSERTLYFETSYASVSTLWNIATQAYVANVGATAAIEIRWKSDLAASVFRSHSRTLIVQKVNSTDVSQATATTPTTTTSTTDTSLNSMTLTPGAGNYLVFFSTSVSGTATYPGEMESFSVYVGGTQVPHTLRKVYDEESLNNGSSFPVAIQAYVTNVGATSPIEVRWNTDLGTATAHQRTLTILKITNSGYDNIATTTSGVTNNISTLNDASGNIHLVYIDSSGNTIYRKYTSSWQTAVTLDSNSGNAFPTISYNSSNDTVYAFWIRSSDIYYKKGSPTHTSGFWDASPTTWQTAGTNTYITSSLSYSNDIFAQWYDGSSVQWSKIVLNQSGFQMQTGYYIGDGADNRAITGVGFQPQAIFIKDDTGNGVDGVIWKSSSMTGEISTRLGEAGADLATDAIQSLDSNGFTLGTYADVNGANVRFTWVAFSGSDCTATGTFCVNSYTGDGSSTHAITTVGFQPNMVMIKGSGATQGIFKTSSMPLNVAQNFSVSNESTDGTRVKTLDATGFTLGNGSPVNTNAANYWYLAFKNSSGIFSEGTFTGDGTASKSINVGFKPNYMWIKNSNATVADSSGFNLTESNGDYTSIGDDGANKTDWIKSLDTSGFTVGAATGVNESGKTIYWFAFAGATQPPASGTFTMKVGTYTGNGTSQSITGLGFAPDLVIIKDETGSNYGVYRTRLMKGDLTSYIISTISTFAGGITSLDSDGFSIGASDTVNTNSTTYSYQAFGNAYNPETGTGAADFTIGAYTGNDLDNRDIVRVPFQPDVIVSKRSGQTGIFKTSDMSGDVTAYLTNNADAADLIQAINSDGFQVGASTQINNLASLHHFYAFKAGTNLKVGTYSGTGATQNITSPGIAPSLVWVKGPSTTYGVMRPSTNVGDLTQWFANVAAAADRITALLSNGFSIGGNQTQTNTAATTYRYVVWKAVSTVNNFQMNGIKMNGIKLN
jgi:hypothetical protein